jgi:ACT domain-containing protein
MSKRAVLTVVGEDQTGIIASVSNVLAEKGINVEDISQTIIQEYFNMIMIVRLEEAQFEELSEALKPIEEEKNIRIQLQLEDVFQAMHRI